MYILIKEHVDWSNYVLQSDFEVIIASFKYPETAYIEALEQTIQEQGIKLEYQQRRLREYEIHIERLTSSHEMRKNGTIRRGAWR